MSIVLDGTTGISGAVDLTTTGNTILGNASTDTLNVGNGNLVTDASGNVGVGVTPSAWKTLTMNAIEMRGNWAALSSNNTYGLACLSNNAYADTDTSWKYVKSFYAQEYKMDAVNGTHSWYTAPSGTAGNAITFTQAMTLDASSNLTVTGGATIQGLTVGRGGGANQNSVTVGYQALTTNTTGLQNIAIGRQALYTNNASYNVAVGDQALYTNSSGSENAAFGTSSLILNTTGAKNTAIGTSALYSNTTASNNTAVGYQALYTNTGASSVAVGYQAGYSLTTEGGNIFIGYRAGYLTTGRQNTFTGYETGYNTSTGIANSFYGYNAGVANTTGDYNVALGQLALSTNQTGTFNTAIGRAALIVATGSNNTAVGTNAMVSTTTGTGNVAVGTQALNSNITGASNTAVGYKAGYAVTGANNVFIGDNVAPNATSGGNNAIIGTSIATPNLTTGSNNVVLGEISTYTLFNLTTENNRLLAGHSLVTNAYVKVAWTVTSDARDKTNIADIPHGLDFVTKLQPKQYQFKTARDEDTPSGNVRYGFLAQDILALEGDAPVIIDNEDADNLKYNGESLVPILVKAIKELKAEIDLLKGAK